MLPSDIVQYSINLKNYFKTNDPFKIAQNLDISINYINLNKKAVQAYTLKPFENAPPIISINSNFDMRSQKILCAHELGHAIFHQDTFNHFDGDSIMNSKEYEANLFAVALLFDLSKFNMSILKMDNYLLKSLLDYNIK